MKENLKKIFYIICLILICILMFFWIDKKEGFHTDEVFSYGTSNCDDSNVYQIYGGKDPDNEMMLDKSIIKTIANVIHYNLNKDEFESEYEEIRKTKSSVWRTREEAKEYVTLDKDEIFNYFVVYYNTGEDVHPPLFYFVVHLVSSLIVGNFSKYIIFSINLVFLILTLWIIRKIFCVLKKEHLIIPATLLYGLSIGAISTVMFQRMYMMLTFFTVCFLYVNLKIYLNDFKLDKKLKWQLCLTILFGFLTQYYFCIYAALVALLMLIFMIRRKDKENIKRYIIQFIKMAIIGIVIFIPCIYHIFFSYRGIGGVESEFNFIQKLYALVKNIFTAQFGSIYLGIVCILIIAIIAFVKRKSVKNKELLLMIILPVIINILIIGKLVPYRSVRYVMNVLPLISIIIILILDRLFIDKKKCSIVLTILSILLCMFSNLITTPSYLYVDYKEYKEIANKYKNHKFVFVCDGVFNHLKNIEELMIYEESLMVVPEKLDILTNDEKLKEEDEFILSIQKWMRK